MKSKSPLSVFLTSAICLLASALFSQGVWVQKANFGGTARFAAAGFSIGSKGYIGIGTNQSFSTFYSDFWEWDQGTNAWTQKATYPGSSAATAISFSIGTKGYIGAGQDTSGSGWTNEFWEYNSANNTWTQKASVPGNPTRAWTTNFSIGQKGYMCGGAKDNGSPLVHYDDLWEYDQSTNAWTQKANFGGGARAYAAGFSIGTKGYVGTGVDNSANPAIDIVTNDFWEWSSTNDTWTQKANFPGVARAHACAFSVGMKGYMGMGMDTAFNGYSDFYEYEPVTNSWNQMANGHIGMAAGFSIGTKGYLGTGFDVNGISNALWQFTPNCNLNLNITTTNSSCGQANGTASVTITNGQAPYTYQWTNGDKTSLADSLSSNLYMVTVTDASGCTAQAPAMVSDAGAPAITVVVQQNLTCNGSEDGAITVSVTGGSQPYTYLWANGNTTLSQTGLDAGPHQFLVTDANGCNAMKIINLTEPAKITFTDSIQNASCGNADGAAAVFVSGGTSPYSYLWNTTPAQTTQIATGLAAGGYSGIVTDANGCTKSGMVTIANLGAPTVTLDSIHPADCATGMGDIYITASGGAGPPYTYLWSNNATTQNLIGVPAGNYGLSVKGGTNPCTAGFSGVLGSKLPYTPSICIVTVDTATGKNQCLFVKDSLANLNIKQYNFFRETTTAGVYQWMGSKPANLPSIWTDQSANPLQRAWRYKITAEDSCGNEAVVSGLHKTIHLAANLGLNNTVNLIWDNYEGISYGTFEIWRYTTMTGWDSLDALPSNLNSYTDLNPPVPIVNVFYYINIKHPTGCSAQIANPGDAAKNPELMATNLNSSKSNIYKVNESLTAVNEASLMNSILIYPNPSSGHFTIKNEKVKIINAEVYNLMGEKIFRGNSLPIDISNQQNGIYFLKLKTNEGTVTRKIVVNK